MWHWAPRFSTIRPASTARDGALDAIARVAAIVRFIAICISRHGGRSMNSIRPLVTITILVVVGAYLYVKINEGPVQPSANAGDAWSKDSPDGVPPLAAPAGATAASETAAPPWATSTTLAPTTTPAIEAPPGVGVAPPALATTNDLTAANGAAVAQPPAMPAIPAMPEAVSGLATSQPATAGTSPPLPIELPANVPTAQYPDQTPATNSTAGIPASAAPLPDASAAAAIAPPVVPETPEQANSLDIAANALATPPLAEQSNPLRNPVGPAAELDPYGAPSAAIASGVTPPISTDAGTAPVESNFAASWPAIKETLDAGKLARAHELLSRWYDDPSLTPTDADMVNSLLSQLAGTVVYSTEHQLEPAYVVRPGDTLESIAKQHNVPWQLLAKINGVSGPDQLKPGQELKVIRGPFSATVDLGRKQLTLLLDGRYAGKFPVVVPSLSAVGEGQWLVDQKLVVPGAAAAQSSYATAPTAIDRAIVLRVEATTAPVTAGSTLTIASGESTPSANTTPPAIRVSSKDAEDLSDILSVGSRVVIRR